MLFNKPDSELARLLRSGPPEDEHAYNAIYTALYPRLVSIAGTYVDRSVAEEIAQDVLGLVWERRARWNIEDGIGVYLYTATRNRALKAVRHDNVIARMERSRNPTAMGSHGESPQTNLERSEIRAAVDAALSELAEGPRTAFLLRWMHELDYPEIARIMGTTEVTVRQQVARGRKAVVPVLEKFTDFEG